MTFQCFFDDSGKESEISNPIVVMAGFISDDWEPFAKKWNSLLLKHGIADVHMKNIIATARERQWDRDRLDAVLLEFMEVITSSPIAAFGVAVDVRHWRTMPKNITEPCGDAQIFCCSCILRMIVTYLELAGQAHRSLCVVFDKDFGYARRRIRLFEEISKFDARVRDSVVQWAFCDARRYSPLQAADVLAWETRRQLINRMDQKPSNARWNALMAAVPEGRLSFAASEFWTKEKLDGELVPESLKWAAAQGRCA